MMNTVEQLRPQLVAAESLTLMNESDFHVDISDAVNPFLIFCDIPTDPMLAPMMIAATDPVLGKLVKLVSMVGPVTDTDMPIFGV